jgi:hypothetical protein
LKADVGCQSQISDSGVIQNMSFIKQFEEQKLEPPPVEKLVKWQKAMTFVFIAYDAFPLIKKKKKLKKIRYINII